MAGVGLKRGRASAELMDDAGLPGFIPVMVEIDGTVALNPAFAAVSPWYA
jgi:hypothetical protein